MSANTVIYTYCPPFSLNYALPICGPSGVLKSIRAGVRRGRALRSEVHESVEALGNGVDARDHGIQQQRAVRAWQIGHGEPFDRGVKIEKGLGHEGGGDF